MEVDEKEIDDDNRNGNINVNIFRLKGPAWRPRLHPGSKAIGIPDVNSHRPKQAEDNVSENAVKDGFSVPLVVGNETFSAHDMIFDRLKANSFLPQLGSLFHEVVLRKDDLNNHRGLAGLQQFRPPTRVTLNEVKLAAYVKELADPDVPLKKLAKSVPHGYRGERMLDMLWNGGNLTPAMAAIKAQSMISLSDSGAFNTPLPRSVAIDRAVWFIRVVGFSELSSSRIRQGNAVSYTVEWTNVFMGWLRKQIVELNVVQANVGTPNTPSSPKTPRVNSQMQSSTGQAHGEQYSLLLEDDFRQKWCQKWHYSIQLLRSLCHQGLIDLQTASKTILDMLRTANIAQITFLLALTEEVLEIIISNATLIHYAVDILCALLVDKLSITESNDFTKSIKNEMQAILSHVLRRCPDAIINPIRWKRHHKILTEISNSNLSQRDIERLIRRNENLSACLLKDEEKCVTAIAEEDGQRRDIAILDKICLESTVEEAFLELFGCNSTDGNNERLRTILVWSTTTDRKGQHRPFAGAQLLFLYSQGRVQKSRRQGKNAIISLYRIDLGTFLFKWISEMEAALEYQSSSDGMIGLSTKNSIIFKSVDVSLLITLLGELIRLGIFSYSKYLQRITARGFTSGQNRGNKVFIGHLHSKMMRSVPLKNMSVSLEHQRRNAIYGNRDKESWEEAMYRRALKEISVAFPWQQVRRDENEAVQWNKEASLRHFWSSSVFIRHRIISAQIVPIFHQSNHLSRISTETFAQVVEIMANAGDFVSLCEVLLLIEASRHRLNPSIVETSRLVIGKYRLFWIGLNLPLLEHVGMDPFPSYSHKLIYMHSPIIWHTNDDLQSLYEQSAIAFVNGNRDQSSIVLVDALSKGVELPETLALTALAAALNVATQQEMASRAVCEWIKFVSFAVGQAWHDTWKHIIVGSLGSLHLNITEDTKWEILSKIILELVQFKIFSIVDILLLWIIPHLEALQSQRAEASVAQYACLLYIITNLFADLYNDTDILAGLRLASIQSELITSKTIDKVFVLLRTLAANEFSASTSKIDDAITSICRNKAVQVYFQPRSFEFCSFIQERIRGPRLSLVIGLLLSSQIVLLQNDAMAIDIQEMIEMSTVWQTPRILFELSFLIHRLENLESGLQYQAQLKVQSTAHIVVPIWFKKITILEFGLPLLLESRSSTFGAKIMEELLKIVHELMQAKDQETVNVVLDTVRCAKYVLDASGKNQSYSPSSIATSILSSLNEQLEINRDFWDTTIDEKQGHMAKEQLDCHLSIICLLMQFDGLWTNQSKVLAPRLVFALIRQALYLSCQCSTHGMNAIKILDVVSFVLQEVPIDVIQTVQGNAEEIIDLIREVMPEDFIKTRILLLLNRPEAGNYNIISPMILGSNCSDLFSTNSKVVIDKPWEYHTNVETLENYHRTNFKKQGEEGEKRDELDGILIPLINNGPISLEYFNAKMSKDRIRSDETKIDSEMSYGLGLGGEPMYARDIRRGLLHLETDEQVKKQAKSLARVKEIHGKAPFIGSVAIFDKASSTSTPSTEYHVIPTKKRKPSETNSSVAVQEVATKKKAKKR